jgi:DNA invertase Pin-like site-specific DNA recombinase
VAASADFQKGRSFPPTQESGGGTGERSSDMEKIWTLADIVTAAEALQPEKAASLRNGAFVAAVATPIITTVLVDGAEKSLRLVDGKHGVAYVRVSTAEQRSKDAAGGFSERDGFSEPDQVLRTAAYYIEKGLAFRVVSDCGLSGFLAVNDPALIARTQRKRARLYRKAFEVVLLNSPVDKWTPAERAGMERYLSQACQAIEQGKEVRNDLHELTIARPEEKPKAAARKKAGNGKPTYRPGLTFLLEEIGEAHQAGRVHTVVCTDISRLSRNDALTTLIMERLEDQNVSVVGVVEAFGGGDDDFASAFINRFYSLNAEFKLREVTIGPMRGITELLKSGRPHSRLPFYLTRDDRGFAHHDPQGLQIIRRMVVHYLENGSYNQTAQALQQEFPHHQQWDVQKVRMSLRNPMLLGRQKVFGKLWTVAPPVVDEETWQRLQEKMAGVRDNPALTWTTKNAGGYMLTGMLKCSCGRHYMYRRFNSSNQLWSYECTAQGAERAAHPEVRHIQIRADHLEGFFDGLMENHALPLLNNLDGGDSLPALQARRSDLAAAVDGLQRKRLAEERAMQQKAEQIVAAQGIGADNSMYPALVANLKKAFTDSLYQEEQERGEELAAVERQLKSMVPRKADDRIPQRLRTWSGMDDAAKNNLLRELFSVMEIRGEAPHEEIHLTPRHPARFPWPPVRILASTAGKGRWKRSLPAVEDWLLGLRLRRSEANIEANRALLEAVGRGEPEALALQARQLEEDALAPA